MAELPEIRDEAWDVIAAFVAANDRMHPVSGSTAVHGGIGGQALTAHCIHLCGHSSHRPDEERYEAVYYQLRRMLEQNRRKRA